MEGFPVSDDRGLNEGLGSFEEDNVRRAAELPDQPNLTRVQMDRDQLRSVTSAEEVSPSRIEIEAMRSFGGHFVSFQHLRGSLRIDFHDERRISDVQIEGGRPLVVHGPPRAPWKDHTPDHRLPVDVYHRSGR